MQVFRSKYNKLSGSRYADGISAARYEYHKVQKRTPRRHSYVRSRYFAKQKVFVDDFWRHLEQKSWRDRTRRTRLFLCGLDLVRNSSCTPEVKQNPNKANERFYRFAGLTKDGEKFYVQIKENKRSGRRDLMSVFPAK